MISENCDIREFVRATEGKDDMDIIRMADLEATEAERRLYRMKTADSLAAHCGREYAQHLKNLIFFIRYGIRPSGLDTQHADLYDDLCRAVPHNGGRCVRTARPLN